MLTKILSKFSSNFPKIRGHPEQAIYSHQTSQLPDKKLKFAIEIENDIKTSHHGLLDKNNSSLHQLLIQNTYLLK